MEAVQCKNILITSRVTCIVTFCRAALNVGKHSICTTQKQLRLAGVCVCGGGHAHHVCVCVCVCVCACMHVRQFLLITQHQHLPVNMVLCLSSRGLGEFTRSGASGWVEATLNMDVGCLEIVTPGADCTLSLSLSIVYVKFSSLSKDLLLSGLKL